MELLIFKSKSKGFVPLTYSVNDPRNAVFTTKEIVKKCDLIILVQLQDWLIEKHNIDIVVEIDTFKFDDGAWGKAYFGLIVDGNNQLATPEVEYINALKQVIGRAIDNL